MRESCLHCKSAFSGPWIWKVLYKHVKKKVLERLLLVQLNKQTSTFQDPLLFSYHCEVGVVDAMIHLLQQTQSHLDKADSTVRIVFFNFASAFNTIQPVFLRKKLQKKTGGCLHNYMDNWRPDKQTTIWETERMRVWTKFWPNSKEWYV